jgi:type I restriction enzyme S subunit
MPNLNTGILSALPVEVPPADEQRRIADVLGALDDLIDVNQVIRATLDRNGLALVEDLLARKLGLEVIPLGEAARIIETGRRPLGGVRGITEGVPSIGAESIKGLAVFDFSKTKFVPADYAAQMRTGVLESRDVLVYKDGGKPGDFRPHVGMFGDRFPFAHMTINEHVYRLRATAPLTEPYLYFWLTSEASMAAMRRLGTGAAIPGLNTQALKAVPVAVPPSDVQGRLYAALDALVGEALAAASEAHQLAQARDEFLPLLLCGRMRVGDVAA